MAALSDATDFEEQYRHMARQVNRILSGEKPGDLPFHLDKSSFVNAKAANALALLSRLSSSPAPTR